MNPFMPHFTNECLESINQNQINWPTVSKKDLIEEEVNFVVQINGKKRALLNVKRDTNEKNILEEILSNQNTKKLLQDQKILKTIFVSNRLINIIL